MTRPWSTNFARDPGFNLTAGPAAGPAAGTIDPGYNESFNGSVELTRTINIQVYPGILCHEGNPRILPYATRGIS